MFAEANRKAIKHTFPVVVPYMTANGQTGAATGTYFFLNEDGWFITALHVIEGLFNILEQYQAGAITNWYAYYGIDGISPEPEMVFGIPEVDLFVGKMKNFKSDMVESYTQFRNPEKELFPGASLCKLGYAFNRIVPTFASNANLTFNPPLVYPLDGIFTRLNVKQSNKYSFPLMELQTSSPGIKGQSGGPVFDMNGDVCAMQNATIPYDLDFGNNQMFYCGTGVYFHTMINFLESINVHYYVSQE